MLMLSYTQPQFADVFAAIHPCLQDLYDGLLKDRLPEYSCHVVRLTSAPLPEQRPRLWWLGSRVPEFPAATWGEEVEHIQKLCQGLPRQHLFPYFAECQDAAAVDLDEAGAETWKATSDYHHYFAKNMAKCCGSVLPKDFVPPKLEARASQTVPALRELGPWARASADVQHLLVEREVLSLPEKPPHMTLIADLSQSCHRAKINIAGTWGTLTTSSKLFDFASQRFLHPSKHFQLLGMDTSKLSLEGLRQSDACLKSQHPQP